MNDNLIMVWGTNPQTKTAPLSMLHRLHFEGICKLEGAIGYEYIHLNSQRSSSTINLYGSNCKNCKFYCFNKQPHCLYSNYYYS